MKKIFFLLVLPIQLLAQSSIDDIRNDSDVVKYIRSQGATYVTDTFAGRWKDVSFDIFGRRYIYREKFTEEDRKFTDSITARRWIIEDFNKDKQKDLVFYGRIGTEVGVYVFLSGAPRQLINLSDMFANGYPHSIRLLPINNTNCIVLGTLAQPESWQSKQKPFAERFYHDTLSYKYDWFVEYKNRSTPGPAFDSIEYRPVSNWVSSPRWHLRIYKNGTAVYVRDKYENAGGQNDFVTEKLSTKIDPQEWRSLIEYINFSTLKDSFELKNVSDQPYGHTRVAYSDGTIKKIVDYGLRGTYGLQALYNKFNFLAKFGKWQLVASRPGYLDYRADF